MAHNPSRDVKGQIKPGWGFKVAEMYSSNAVMKEKSIKIVQYASQMMLGFYAPTLSPQQREKFSTALFMCSTCRKSIRFLKFITMFREAVEKYNSKKKIDVEGALEVLEPFFTSWYFIGDNVVLLERLQVIRKAPNFFVHLLNWGDFMMDLSSMAHKSIKIRRCARRRAEVLHRLKSLREDLETFENSQEVSWADVVDPSRSIIGANGTECSNKDGVEPLDAQEASQDAEHRKASPSRSPGDGTSSAVEESDAMANGIIPIAEGQGTRHAKRANRFVQEDDTFVIKGHVEGNGSPMSVGTVATSFTSSSGSKSITALGQTSPQRWADFAADTYSTRAQHREALISAVAECEKELDELFYEQYGYCHTFLISLAQVVSSGDIPMVWKYIFGKACPQGYVGMSGVISSSLVILREIQLNLPPWDPKTKVD